MLERSIGVALLPPRPPALSEPLTPPSPLPATGAYACADENKFACVPADPRRGLCILGLKKPGEGERRGEPGLAVLAATFSPRRGEVLALVPSPCPTGAYGCEDEGILSFILV